ncbi:MAG: lactate racemase domain-containing protein [Acidobacteriota bacterium]
MSRPEGWIDLLDGVVTEVVGPSRPGGPDRDPCGLIREALAAARLDLFLHEAAACGSPLIVVVNDPSRRTDTRAALAAIVERAEARRAGARFRLLVACGSHTFSARAAREFEERLLAPVAGRVEAIAWHRAGRGADLAEVGPYRLHRWLVEARHAIAIGSAEPHYFAGLAGAHKTLTVGLMSAGDLRSNHEGAMSARAAPLAAGGNPVYEGIEAVVSALEGGGRRLFAVNLVMAGDRVLACFAGRPREAARSALPLVRASHARELTRPVDLVVARVRPPLDRTLYQADKGIKNVEGAVRDGGVILLDAACPGGVGADRFLRLLRRAGDHASAARAVEEEGYRLGDHKAVRLRALTERRGVRLGVVSDALPEETVRLLHAEPFRDRAAAARWARTLLGHRRGRRAPRGLLVEDAGHLLLRLRRPAAWEAI